MIFNEIYGAYYETIEAALNEILKKPEHVINSKELDKLIGEHAFSESSLQFRERMKSEEWLVLGNPPEAGRAGSWTTPIKHPVPRIQTELQKRWLKTILLDRRIRLFLPEDYLEDENLSGISPLFDPKDFVYFDRNRDGDPYEDPGYIQRFRTVLQAIHRREELFIQYTTQGGKGKMIRLWPEHLEYCSADDRFRLLGAVCRQGRFVRLSVENERIGTPRPCAQCRNACCGRKTKGDGGTEGLPCEKCSEYMVYTIVMQTVCSVKATGRKVPGQLQMPVRHTRSITFLLEDRNDSLNRVLRMLSCYKMITRKKGDGLYEITILCLQDETSDALKILLSLGTYVTVTKPLEIRRELHNRLQKQIRMFQQSEIPEATEENESKPQGDDSGKSGLNP